MSNGVTATNEGALRLAHEMNEAALGLAAATSPADIAEVALAALSRGLGAASGALWILDEARGGLVRAGRGLGDEVGIVPYSDESPAGYVLRRDTPVFLDDASAYEARFPVSWARVKDYETTGDRAFAVVPASVSASEPRAVLVAWFDGPRTFNEDERSLLAVLGRLCAHSLERTELLARTTAETRRAALAAAEAERKLDFERARMARVLEEMSVAVMLVDTNGDVLLINRAVSALWRVEEFPKERAERLRMFRGFTADGKDVAADEWPFAITRDTRQASQRELRIVRPDGTEMWILMAASPVAKADGSLEAIVTTALDISAIKSAQEETARARAAAEDANRAKDEFLAILGHELRNPLAPIATALHLMNERGSDYFARERSVIERQVGHLGRLIDDLLDVSRIARGNIELLRRNVEIADVIERALELSRPLLERNQNAIRLSVPATGLMVDGDATRLAQVFANLLTNASKYSPAGAPITLEAHKEDGYVVATVQDEGIGIPAELLPRVFDVFVQGPQSIDRARGGLGLGLAIVKNLAEMHGGSVAVKTAGERRGSELVVRLPLATGEVGRVTPEPAVTPPTGGPLRILIVDDNVDAAELLADVLGHLGHACTLAADGASGLAAAKEARPHVVLLDLGLPMIDGFEVARALGAAELEPRPAIVALTGYGTAADRARTTKAGFAEHLVKPVDLQQLKRILSRVAAANDGAPIPRR